MPLTDPKLWKLISTHRMSLDGGSLNAGLRRDHGISSRTASSAIREYRRFLYLTAIARRRTVPSRAVDAVWHLHMDGADYARLTHKISRPIDHAPGTPAGHGEDYRRTLQLYHAEFDEHPPRFFWGDKSMGWGLLFLGAVPLFFAALTVWTHGFAWNVALFGGIGLLFLALWLRARVKSTKPGKLHDPGRGDRRGDGGLFGGSSDCGGADCGGGGGD